MSTLIIKHLHKFETAKYINLYIYAYHAHRYDISFQLSEILEYNIYLRREENLLEAMYKIAQFQDFEYKIVIDFRNTKAQDIQNRHSIDNYYALDFMSAASANYLNKLIELYQAQQIIETRKAKFTALHETRNRILAKTKTQKQKQIV